MQVVLNITNTFDSSFGRWTVGLGIEHQLNELRAAAGLPEEARFRARARNLDYSQLTHPEVGTKGGTAVASRSFLTVAVINWQASDQCESARNFLWLCVMLNYTCELQTVSKPILLFEILLCMPHLYNV